ncbi:MAG: NAD-dependent epimerase/dehydratase family protein [Candidatus Hodarchaeota archaeon]
MSKVLAITGAASYISRHLIPYLNSSNMQIDQFIGLDIRAIGFHSEIPFSFYKCDIRDDFSKILEEYGVTDLIHLAWTVSPIHNKKKAYQVDIEGTKNTLVQTNKANIDYFLHTSSTLCYGAYPDNPYPLTENDQLRGNKNFHYSHHKTLAEQLLDEFEKSCEMKIGRIRPSPILSGDLNSYVSEILRGGWRTFFSLPYPNKDTHIQFLHISDVLKGFQIMLEHRLGGPYNLTPDYDVKVGEIPEILRKRGLRIPYRVLKILLWFQWKLRLSQVPPAYLDFVAYPYVASNQKLRKYGFLPEYSTKEALTSLIKPSSVSKEKLIQ